MLEAFKWFMEHDIPLKNAASGLAGLLSTVFFFFLACGEPWFAEIQAISGGVWLMLGVVFAIVFLAVNIIWFFGIQILEKRVTVRQQRDAQTQAEICEQQKMVAMFETLVSLTEWQKGILIEQLRSNHPRFEAYEIGGYKVIWQTEIDELIRKKIVRQHSYDVFEVTPSYWDFLRDHYDLESNKLSLDDLITGQN